MRGGRVLWLPHQLLRWVDDADGYENGYNVTRLNDGTEAISPEEHETALAYDFPMLSEPTRSAELIEQLG